MSDPHFPDAAVFTVTAAGGQGLTRSQTRGAAFVRTSRGVVARREALIDVDVADRAALLGCDESAVLTDVSAARAWRLPLPPWIGLDDHARPRSIAVVGSTGRPRRGDVRGRRIDLPDDHLSAVRGLSVTSPARTYLDCAALIPREHVVVMGDAILRRNLASMDELRSVVAWGRGRRGVRQARTSLPLLDRRSESPGESLARAHLLLSGLPAPECNYDVFDATGWIARADMAWTRERVIVEYDGQVHSGEKSRRSDAARRNLLQRAGWYVIVLTARDLGQPWVMCGLVAEALRTRRVVGRGSNSRSEPGHDRPLGGEVGELDAPSS